MDVTRRGEPAKALRPMPRHDFARPDNPAFPAPNAGVFRLLSLLRRPVPLADLRLLATAAGMAEPDLAAALSTATRRQVIGLVAIAGTACYVVKRGRA
jgi:hypothetical protein